MGCCAAISEGALAGTNDMCGGQSVLTSHFKYWAAFSVFSIAAIILTVKRCIEQGIRWLAVDAIEMFMWWHTGADSMAILAIWTLFFVDGCYCYALWLRK